MLKRIVSGTIFVMLLAGMLTSAFIIGLVKAQPKAWTAEDDGTTDVSMASIRHSSTQTIKSSFKDRLDTRLMDAFQLPLEASGKWDFENEVKWRDFTYTDDYSAELVIGLNVMRPNSYPELVDLVTSNGGELVNTVSMNGKVRAVVASIPHGAVSTFASEVEMSRFSRYIEPNVRFELDLVPNDPDWLKQWGPVKIETDDAWDTQTGDPSVVVAVVDTGVDWNHPDLISNYVALGYDWVNNDPDPMDDHGHGTHCTGIIAATLNNGIGIAGLAQVRIMAEKGLGPGGGWADDLAKAIVHAVDQGANIISCSWGSYAKSTLIHEALKYAYSHDVLVIGAAGNSATDLKHYPAAYSEVVATTATDESDNPAEFTNFGDWVEIAAPGVDVYSTWWDDTYMYASGTSMSAPHVAGAAAMVWSQFPTMTRNHVRAQLRSSADDLGDPSFDVYYGYGRVNARRAVEQAPCEHDILVLSWKKPQHVNLGKQAMINGTILNAGTSDENGITVQLLINGSVVDSRIVGFLSVGACASVSCSWVPTVEGVYNVTYYVVPVLGETVTKNNAISTYMSVRLPEVIRVPDDYETIQSAINAAKDEDTVFVASGIYYEEIWINKKGLSLVGEDVSSTIIQGTEVVVAADNVYVNGFTIQNSNTGIVVYGSEGSIINNTRTLNNIIGIYLLYSVNITLTNNNMTANGNNLDVDGYCLSEFIHNVDASNLVNGKPVYYWIDEYDRQVPSDAGYVAVVNSTRIAIKDLNLANNGEGVLLVCTTNSAIENVSASHNYDGVYLAHSSINTVGGCFVTDNNNGIYLYESIDNNVSHNIVVSNRNGINSYYSNDNKINSNELLKNNDLGLFLEKSYNNTISNNRVFNNTYGIYSRNSGCNVLRDNNMTDNEYNFGVTGSYLSHFVQDVDTSNKVNGKPIYYLLHQKDKEISDDAGYVAVVNSTNITVTGLDLMNNVHGVLFAFTSGSLVENVNTSNNTYGVFLYDSSNNTILGNAVTSKGKRGIQLVSSNNNTVGNNTITNNYVGVGLWLLSESNEICNNVISNFGVGGVELYSDHSGSNTFSNNTVTGGDYGIELYYSGSNTFDSNTVTNNDYGMELYYSDNSTLRNNNITGNSYNLGVYGESLSNFIHEIDTSNLVNGRPVYYLVNQHDKSILGHAGYVAAINSTSVSVEDLMLTDNGQGVLFAYTTNSTITNVTAFHNYDGIYLRRSDCNTIGRNNVTTNERVGIYLLTSDNNTISGNNLTHNDYGLRLYKSSNNTISGNKATSNEGDGIGLHYSNDNTIADSIVTHNTVNIYLYNSNDNTIVGNKESEGTVGILLTESKGNVIRENAASDNAPLGLGLDLSYNNTIYHNNFIGNMWHVWSLDSMNTWDDGYPSGGNYWSDYSGVDLFYGPHQNETGSDRIGDIPYFINGTDQDRYPLMNPWTPTPVARFTWSPRIPKVDQSVTFNASYATPNGGTIRRYEWSFGDGETASGKMATHTFANLGAHTVTLNVTDSEALWDIEQKQVQVVQPYGPKAEFTWIPSMPKVGDFVIPIFDASVSMPGWNGTHEMHITEYRWDFGDGNKTITSISIVQHIFSSSGNYYVTLTVYAPGATPETDTISHKVTVISAPIGGYSLPLKRYATTRPLTLYLAVIAILTSAFTIIRRRTDGRTKHPRRS